LGLVQDLDYFSFSNPNPTHYLNTKPQARTVARKFSIGGFAFLPEVGNRWYFINSVASATC